MARGSTAGGRGLRYAAAHGIPPGRQRAILRAMLVLGGVLAAMAAFLAGASGFGRGLVATPLLLLSGFSLPFVVTVNLLISLATRISVVWRTRTSITWRRAGALVGGAVPGLW